MQSKPWIALLNEYVYILNVQIVATIIPSVRAPEHRPRRVAKWIMAAAEMVSSFNSTVLPWDLCEYDDPTSQQQQFSSQSYCRNESIISNYLPSCLVSNWWQTKYQYQSSETNSSATQHYGIVEMRLKPRRCWLQAGRLDVHFSHPANAIRQV